jgi:hypothetical protein
MVQQRFESIVLRVRGIKRDEPFTYLTGKGQRLAFPDKVIDQAELIPANYCHYFVEPNVRQSMTYVTTVPTSLAYILVRVKFKYDKSRDHTAERAFKLAQDEPDKRAR